MGRPTALDRVRFAWHDVRSFIGRVFEGADESNVPVLASGLTFAAIARKWDDDATISRSTVRDICRGRRRVTWPVTWR